MQIVLNIKRSEESQISVQNVRKFNLGKEYKLVKHTDYEWLSLNWRNYRVTKIDNSYRRTILYLVEQDYQYFPTLNEIRDGLLEGQRNKFF